MVLAGGEESMASGSSSFSGSSGQFHQKLFRQQVEPRGPTVKDVLSTFTMFAKSEKDDGRKLIYADCDNENFPKPPIRIGSGCRINMEMLQLQREGLFTDIQIKCQDGFFHIHSMILASLSPRFAEYRKKLDTQSTLRDEDGPPVLRPVDLSRFLVHDVAIIIFLLYTGESLGKLMEITEGERKRKEVIVSILNTLGICPSLVLVDFPMASFMSPDQVQKQMTKFQGLSLRFGRPSAIAGTGAAPDYFEISVTGEVKEIPSPAPAPVVSRARVIRPESPEERIEVDEMDEDDTDRPPILEPISPIQPPPPPPVEMSAVGSAGADSPAAAPAPGPHRINNNNDSTRAHIISTFKGLGRHPRPEPVLPSGSSDHPEDKFRCKTCTLVTVGHPSTLSHAEEHQPDIRRKHTDQSIISKLFTLLRTKRRLHKCTFPGCQNRYTAKAGLQNHLKKDHIPIRRSPRPQRHSISKREYIDHMETDSD